MNKILLLLTTSVVILSGCSTTKSIKYPTAGSRSTISVSSEQISAMTESGGGDYFIEGSQITVGDASNALASPTSGMFGLIGVGVATAIDKKANGSAVSKSNLKRAIKFDDLVNSKITNALQSYQIDSSLKVISPNQPSEIKVVPYSRISFRDKPNVYVAFALKSQFKNSADGNSSIKRFYHYVNNQKAPLSDWDANNNEMFLKSANIAFDTLSKVLVLDAQHQLNFEVFSETKQKTCKLANGFNSYYFIDAPDNLCIGVLKTTKGQVLQNTVFVLEQ
ncbi:hypothetical protein [Acinetobacter stercoris]|uniref:Lipoprotein n=1 Tax=Acinetobacter stercoris TaxID=2126983 RepID=A0A2U3N498_9GAMM|nr:hypothetical protein [Acinetobacter stercoris]SPL72491.1 hypothetical protein KPC_3669 [Acinetobacter stercoris]